MKLLFCAFFTIFLAKMVECRFGLFNGDLHVIRPPSVNTGKRVYAPTLINFSPRSHLFLSPGLRRHFLPKIGHKLGRTGRILGTRRPFTRNRSIDQIGLDSKTTLQTQIETKLKLERATNELLKPLPLALQTKVRSALNKVKLEILKNGAVLQRERLKIRGELKRIGII